MKVDMSNMSTSYMNCSCVHAIVSEHNVFLLRSNLQVDSKNLTFLEMNITPMDHPSANR